MVEPVACSGTALLNLGRLLSVLISRRAARPSPIDYAIVSHSGNRRHHQHHHHHQHERYYGGVVTLYEIFLTVPGPPLAR